MLLIFSSFIPILKYDSLPISMELFCNINGISTKLSHSLLILPSLIGQFFSPGHHQYPQFTRDVNFLYSYHSFCCNECCYSCITCIQDSTSYHICIDWPYFPTHYCTFHLHLHLLYPCLCVYHLPHLHLWGQSEILSKIDIIKSILIQITLFSYERKLNLNVQASNSE